MNRILFFVFIIVISAGVSFAQNRTDSTTLPVVDSIITQDSIIVNDSLPLLQTSDSVSKMPLKDSGWTVNLFLPSSRQHLDWQLLQRHPYFGFSATPLIIHSAIRQINGKELLFYLLVFLLFVYAILRKAFPKYFNDLFRLFFRTTLKQRQTREQLMQTPLPSLLLNGFFVITGGLYITFLLQHFKLNLEDDFWLTFLYCILCLSGTYLVKFIGLKISGWLFNIREAADSYIFIVFISNKMIGILLLPFLILLSFTAKDVYSISLVISWCLIFVLMIYRFILAITAIRNQVKVNPFHFFLYCCAFEIAPLLLVYKALLLYFRITT